MNNPGMDLANWERLRKKWHELLSIGHPLNVEYRLITHPKDENKTLAIDVIQTVGDDIFTEIVESNAGEGYEALGLAGVSMEQLVQGYKELMHNLYRQAKSQDVEVSVKMDISSPLSGELLGYIENHAYNTKSTLTLNYRHYYILSALREKMIDIGGDGWNVVRAVYRFGGLEFYFEY